MSYGREYYYDQAERKGQYPLDEQLGIDGEVSVGVKRLLVKLSARMPYQAAVDVFEELAQVKVSATTAWEQTQAAGERIRAAQKPIPTVGESAGTALECMGITMDGCMANVRSEGWKEVKVGCVFEVVAGDDRTQNKQGESVPVVHAKSQSYVLHLGGPEEFGFKLSAETAARGWHAAHQSALLGDGAVWIWNLANKDYETSAHIVDWYHAKQHLFSAAQVTCLDQPDRVPAWVEQHADLLYAGQADHIAERLLAMATRANPDGKAKLETEAGYFSSNHQRMQYRDFQLAGLPIGSGTVESAAKQTKQRLSAAGMRWSRPGLENILPLRAALMSNAFDHLWRVACPC